MADRILTSDEQAVLIAISEYISANKYPPSIRELVAITGAKSTSTVHARLKALERKGYIETQTSASRAIRVLKDYHF